MVVGLMGVVARRGRLRAGLLLFLALGAGGAAAAAGVAGVSGGGTVLVRDIASRGLTPCWP